jgi:toxin ParE1/3/4
MDYIAADSLRAAVRMDELFHSAALGLAKFPQRGKPGIVPGTREVIPHESYRLIYEVTDGTVWVLALALVHTARLWPFVEK